MKDQKPMRTKQEIRREILSRRDSEPLECRIKNSFRICDRLRALKCYRNAVSVYCYVSFRSEADTRALLSQILADGKKLFVPHVDALKKEMEFYEITSLAELIPGSFGILEPDLSVCTSPECHPSGLMILPGAAFDRSGRRIGYGGGYYDRYLQRYPDFYKAALAFECQLAEVLPQEKTDIQVDMILTEQDCISVKQP